MYKRLITILVFPLCVSAKDDKLTVDQRIEISRGLTAEYATVKTFLPRSKKALPFESTGTYDKKAWEESGKELGPAARVGDLVQITKVVIEQDKILLEINGGMKGKRKWYENIEVGMGNRTTPVSSGQNTNAPGGTSIALLFGKPVPPLQAAEIKKLLLPILDFEKQTATENIVESLPPEIKQAVKENRAIDGMNRDQVILALGKPRTKQRETRDGVEEEHWIYGNAPGKITFITFAGSTVVKVKEAYAGLGGQTVPSLPPQ
jgi:hypothetical protein